MPIQLDKILIDVAEEKVLCPNYPEPKKKDVDDAWTRVSKKNDLSVHEARSIFKVLQKKYEQEKVKDRSGWKLFQIMHDIHKMNTPDSTEEEALPMEEDEEYEMLEVQEEEEQQQTLYTGNTTSFAHMQSASEEASDGENTPKSQKSESSLGSSPERYDKQITKTTTTTTTISPVREEKKVLNSLVSSNVRNSPLPSSTAVALQKKGITVKKTIPGSNTKISGITLQQPQTKTILRNGQQVLEVGKTIRMPEAIKRKLSEDYSSPLTKKFNYSQAIVTTPIPHVKTPLLAKPIVLKKEIETENVATTTPAKNETKSQNNETGSSPNNVTNSSNTSHQGISLITIPVNSTATNEANNSLSVNGNGNGVVQNVAGSTNNGASSPRGEEMEFCNDIIFETNNGNGDSSPSINNASLKQQKNSNGSSVQTEGGNLNLGNSDNILPRTFFKNLCTSNRFEALGLYVANAMNRLNSSTAARLEMNILRAIIDAQTESSGLL